METWTSLLNSNGIIMPEFKCIELKKIRVQAIVTKSIEQPSLFIPSLSA